METKLWAVRADETFDPQRGVIAFGWADTGDLSALPDAKDAFRTAVDAAYPHKDAAHRSANVGVLYRLVHEMKEGDYVACVHGANVSLGTVSGVYAFRENCHLRPVRWMKNMPQSAFSHAAMREITCSPVPLFAVRRFGGEFLALLGVSYVEPPKRPVRPYTVSASIPRYAAPVRSCAVRDTADGTADFVLNVLRRSVNREDFRRFAAGLLRAMGYIISIPSDGGLGEFDMAVQRDELFPPVQVSLSMDVLQEGDAVRLRDALEPGHYGLVMALRGTSERARHTLRDAPYLRVIDGAEIANLTLRYYCFLDEHCRNIVPLRMVYVPNR